MATQAAAVLRDDRGSQPVDCQPPSAGSAEQPTPHRVGASLHGRAARPASSPRAGTRRSHGFGGIPLKRQKTQGVRPGQVDPFAHAALRHGAGLTSPTTSTRRPGQLRPRKVSTASASSRTATTTSNPSDLQSVRAESTTHPRASRLPHGRAGHALRSPVRQGESRTRRCEGVARCVPTVGWSVLSRCWSVRPCRRGRAGMPRHASSCIWLCECA
jgi:hypothetical protein